MTTRLKIQALPHASLVTLRNNIPTVLHVWVETEVALKNVWVQVEHEPAVVEPYRIFVPEVPADKGVQLPGLTGRYAGKALMELEEPAHGTVRAILTQEGAEEQDEVLAECCEDIFWHPHDVWVGGDAVPEMLAALVYPQSTQVQRIVEDAASILRSVNLPDEWVGYRGQRNAILNRLHALWDAVQCYGVKYALPPECYTGMGLGQIVRVPEVIFREKVATCLDSTLLLAAAVAAIELNPIVILCPGHAFLGVCMKDDGLPEPVVRDLGTIRTLLQLDDLLVLETTALTQATPECLEPFSKASAIADETMEKLQDSDAFVALDIVRIWDGNIKSTVRPKIEGEEEDALPQLEFVNVPDPEPFLPEDTVEQMEQRESLLENRPRTRMENWQLKLLDLSMRNNLLNTRMNGSLQMGILLPDVAALEDELADGRAFRIKPLPELLSAQAAQEMARVDDKHLMELQRKLSADMFAKHELLASDGHKAQNEQQLQRCLQKLYLAARRDLEETGANSLYLACGFLKWFRKDDRDKAMRAPILLIPVTLTRQSVRAGYSLRSAGEETRVNMTLLELLKTEYDLRIPELEGELPTDESGLDVPRIFNIVRRAIIGMKGWEVEASGSLGIFSFTKYLMWKDLVDRREVLLKNPVVSHIAAENRSLFPVQVDFPDPSRLDDDVDPQKVFAPLSSDSSQLSAVLAAARGKSFVLIGPPGTGKSQTIANMIAHCLGHGKTVLFVAEKSAALSVVHKRLKRIGLANYCLELHSTKANKKEAILQFKSAVEAAAQLPERTNWGNTVQTMARLRTLLNMLPEEMHRKYPDGTSLYDDICRIAETPDLPEFAPVAEELLTMTAERRDSLRRHTDDLLTYHEPVADILDRVNNVLSVTSYSGEWATRLADLLPKVSSCSEAEDAAFAGLMAALAPGEGDYYPVRRQLVSFMCKAREWQGRDMRSLSPTRAERTLTQLRELLDIAAAYQAHRQGLSLPYPADAVDAPELRHWLTTWKQAQLSNFISRWWTNRKVRKYLQVLACSAQTPDCRKDLESLVKMKELKAEYAEMELSALRDLHKGLETQPSHITAAQEVAASAASCGLPLELLDRFLSPDSTPLYSGSPVATALEKCSGAMAALDALLPELQELIAQPWQPENVPGAGAAAARDLLSLRSRWREVALWNKSVKTAQDDGAGAIAECLISGAVAPEQLTSAVEVNLSRLRMRAAADAVETLVNFLPAAHEKHISQFAEQDKAVQDATIRRIRELLAERASGVAQYGQEVAILQRELAKQRAHMPLRKLLAATPHASALLKPCMLMSPLSVAQFLTPESDPYDVVIFDEASQIPVWDAIGALARGHSAIVVGDPRQMPPTSFFARAQSEDDDSVVEHDMESILDECLACGIPKMNLAWHYRSKSESLIAFSNHCYYEGLLTTFPAPVSTDLALQYHFTGGTYEPGASKRTNLIEAQALVKHVVDTLRSPDFRYTEATSIGIVTFNTQQQRLILDLLDEARAKDEFLEPFFSDSCGEPIFVKNLENVQGDERGVIYFSTTFGPDSRGNVSMNFGPLNLTGGERRLNVAITRARCGMHVFSSLKPEHINLSRTRARGVADFRQFLECARMGAGRFFNLHGGAVATAARNAVADAICAELETKSWKCSRDLGVSGFRVDIAVQHPELEGTMLAGIMMDGPGYAKANTARDRDVLRGSVMSVLGWRLLHLWSIDWWRDREACMQRLCRSLAHFLELGPPEPPELPSLLPDSAEELTPSEVEIKVDKPAEQKPAPTGAEYKMYDHLVESLPEMTDAKLRKEILACVQTEGPVVQERVLRHLCDLTAPRGRAGDSAYASVLNRMGKRDGRCPLTPSLRARMMAAISDLTADGKIALSVEEHCDLGKHPVLRAAGAEPVLVRQRGPRDWTEIPASELLQVAEMLRGHYCCLNGCDDHIRHIHNFYDLTRVNRKFKDFLVELIQSTLPKPPAP